MALIALPLMLLALAPVAKAQGVFVDVDTDSEYGPAVLHLQSEAIVQGFADGTFRPLAGITRAEYTKILLLAKYEPQMIAACQTPSFADVAAEAWYFPYLCYAKQQGIVAGFGDGLFRPNNPISYAEGAKILVNTLIAQTADAPSPAWWSPYTDLLEDHGVKPPTVGMPTGPLKRGEMAFMVSGIIRTTIAGFIQNRFDGKIVYVNNPGTTVAELQAHCSVEGGTFEECGSPCEPGAAVCASVCAYTCDLLATEDGIEALILQRFGSKIVYETGDNEDETALRQHCATEGGLYKSCGNTCAPDAEVCTEVCAHTCEQIPATDEEDDTGVTIESDFVSKLVYTLKTDQDEAPYRAHCTARGGSFAACGSPCAPDAEVCAQVCAFTCDDIPDEGADDALGEKSYQNLALGFAITSPATARLSEGGEGESAHVEIRLRGKTQADTGPLTDGAIIRISRLKLGNESLSSFVDAEIAAERSRTPITLAKERSALAEREGYRFGSQSGVFTYLPAGEGEAIALYTLVKDPANTGYAETVEAMLDSLRIIETATVSLGDGRLSLRYPTETLAAARTADRLTLSHQVPYVHADVCDGQGTAAPLTTLTDFAVEWHLLPQGLPAAVTAQEAAGFADEHLGADGSSLIERPGFVEKTDFQSLNGFVVRLGAEGCGENHYYFPLDEHSTLFVRQRLVGEFSEANALRDEALSQPGVIAEDQANALFRAIMQSVTVPAKASS